MELERVKKIGKCCISGKPLSTSVHVNMVELDYQVEWEYPRGGNVLTGEEGKACAYIHDDCIDAKGKLTGEIKYAVEFQGNKIIYHPVETLKRSPGYGKFRFGQNAQGIFIECLTCKQKSYNPNDIKERYCGNCHVFHLDETKGSPGEKP